MKKKLVVGLAIAFSAVAGIVCSFMVRDISTKSKAAEVEIDVENKMSERTDLEDGINVKFSIPSDWFEEVDFSVFAGEEELKTNIINEETLADSEGLQYVADFTLVSSDYEEYPEISIVFSDGIHSTKQTKLTDDTTYNIDGFCKYGSDLVYVIGSSSLCRVYYYVGNDYEKDVVAKLNYYDLEDSSGEIYYSNEVVMEKSAYEGYYKAEYYYSTERNFIIKASFTTEDGTNDDNYGVLYTLSNLDTIAKQGIYNITPAGLAIRDDIDLVDDNISNIPSDDISDNTNEEVTIFYFTTWNTPNIHYKVNGEKWTQLPGKSMEEYNDLAVKSEEAFSTKIVASSSDEIKLCFNDNYGNWDNNNSKNYTVTGSEVYTIIGGIVYNMLPEEVAKENILTLYYYTGWSTPHIHFKAGDSSWTAVPGTIMKSTGITGYYKYTIDLGLELGVNFCFNNGGTSWDNNQGKDYYLNKAGSYIVRNGEIREGSMDSKAPVEITEKKAIIHYAYSGDESDIYIHYKIGDNKWTALPGVLMEKESEGMYKITIDLGDYITMKFCFNNGGNSWDNNSNQDYTIAGPGEYYIIHGKND